jgi:transcriptional regulator with GAF, ATPase, and Fis domain
LQAGGEVVINHSLTLDEAQNQHITSVLALSHWQISGDKGAAVKLGLPESTLRSKMRKLGITKYS